MKKPLLTIGNCLRITLVASVLIAAAATVARAEQPPGRQRSNSEAHTALSERAVGMKVEEIARILGAPADDTYKVGACGILEIHTWHDVPTNSSAAPRESRRQPSAFKIITTDGVVSSVVDAGSPTD